MTGGLPLFPLATVLFPGLVLPLHIFEPRYRTLMRDLLDLPADQAREFGVVAVRHGGVGSGEDTDDLYQVGCTAQVRQVTENPDGTFDIVTVGQRRFALNDIDRTAHPYLTADVAWLPEQAGDPGLAEELAPRVLAGFQRYLDLIRADAAGGEQLPDDPTVLSHLVAASAVLSLDERQRLLEEPDTASRLRAERRLLSRESVLLSQVRAVPVALADLGAKPGPN